ncbi:PhzF family phenazine biosynthesis protein [Aestuariivivens insulae]|uniref:PhzF family phenazine biosynthesis protein n=1 Tax=Aestuariivivens insulae TaxID=1621988 RepID=UPI001F5918BE|nr:PhzF family phenazine biosynthesis protein [Aestuariivivens insulae]
MKLKVNIVNAFIDNGKGGNPAGVVLNADDLTTAKKLEIAKKVGLSETAFVSQSNQADFKLDFFTPTRQIAHCGHATIAVFSLLKQLGKLQKVASSKETIDGIRNIRLKGDLAFMEQSAPIYTNVSEDRATILSSLGLASSDLIEGAPIQLVNTGNSFIIIPVERADSLKNIQPNHELISKISNKYNLIGFYVFTTHTTDNTYNATTRMFAPRYGIPEEAATGMAAGPLACYLHDMLKVKKENYMIQQGKYMTPPSPSAIQVELLKENGKIISLMAGGKGIVTKDFEIEL